MRTRPNRFPLALTLFAGVALAFHAAPAHALTCFVCGPFGCEGTAMGFLSCWSGSLGGQPVCMCAGACPASGGDGGGGDVEFFDKRRSSTMREAGAVVAPGGLRLFWVTVPVEEGVARRFEERAVVVRAGVDPADPEGFVRAVAARAGLPPGRAMAANAEMLVGPSSLSATFVTPEGDGYTIDAEWAGAGATVGVCRVQARSPNGSIARDRVPLGDLLIVPVRLQGEHALMALTVATPYGLAPDQREREARERVSFMTAGRSLTAHGRHRGYKMELLPTSHDCW
jgi:hypothetical protein